MLSSVQQNHCIVKLCRLTNWSECKLDQSLNRIERTSTIVNGKIEQERGNPAKCWIGKSCLRRRLYVIELLTIILY